MHFSLRLARPSDFPRLESIALESFAPCTWQRTVDARFGPLNGRDWRERWKRRLSAAFVTQHVLIAEAGAEVVAFATASVDHETRLGHIDLLAVDAAHRRRGYGRGILRGMVRYLRDRNAEHVTLECPAENEAAGGLYRSAGFEPVARCTRWFARAEALG